MKKSTSEHTSHASDEELFADMSGSTTNEGFATAATPITAPQVPTTISTSASAQPLTLPSIARDVSQVEDIGSRPSGSNSEGESEGDESFDESDYVANQQQRMQDMYRSISPRTRTSRDSFTYDDEDITEMNAREQELLVGIQELQRQLSMVQIQTEKSQEEILPPVADSRRRLIMVSNRLPISFQKNETTGEWSFKMSSGGLVTALNGIRDEVPFIWIGWLGEEIAHEDQNKVREKLAKEFNCVPVFLSKEIASRYYNDFSNDILWPTFHYVPLPLFKAGQEKKFDFRLWDAYKLANKLFAQAVNQVYREGDYVWVHDYHLMNLPSLLRKRHPKCKIGWFLHTPFPSSEMYRTLPVGKQILEGLLGADLLGFHTYDYARHFLSACARIPGASSTPKGIEFEDHFSSVGVFPIGIDPEHFENILETEATQNRIKELCVKFAGFKIIIGVDRMDYIKGIPHRMLAMERFLAAYPERRENVVLIQIAVPSRTGVQEYQELAASVNEMVGRINGRFGTLQHSPVHYIHQSVTPTELVALYNVADVCLVTSIRDGMNLVSYEYVMCQSKPCEGRREGPGVLVLSEFAGSAQSLSGAIRVNPWNNTDMANALEYALTLPAMEREYRQTNLYRYVKTHTASFWGKSFLTDLEYACSRPTSSKKLVKLPTMDLINAYSRSKKRIIVLDYEGTLLDESHQRSTIAPPKAFVKRIIENLAADKKNTVLLVSGHERSVIGSWLNDKRIGVVAESGYYYRLPHANEWEMMAEDMDPSWKRVVRPIMQYFTERTPGSYIETKESSLTWHYGETDPIFGPMQARDMQINLEDVLCNLPLEVIQGTNRVEVRLQGITKTVIIEEILKQFYHAQSPANTPGARSHGGTVSAAQQSAKQHKEQQQQVDFVFCAGNGLEDDDLFTFFTEHQELAKKKNDAQSASKASSPPPAAPASGGLPPLPPAPPVEFADATTIMSSALSSRANVYTCHIGANKTEAMYHLERPTDLLRVLRVRSVGQAGAGLARTLRLPSNWSPTSFTSTRPCPPLPHRTVAARLLLLVQLTPQSALSRAQVSPAQLSSPAPPKSRKMCPLRYILLLLSLLVAMIGLSQAMSEQEMSAITDGAEDDEEKSKQQQQKTTFRTLVDMLNGKYLYDAYKTSQMRVKSA